jgi:mannose-6-phosphate isomerase-like protein (cupin superfamily)
MTCPMMKSLPAPLPSNRCRGPNGARASVSKAAIACSPTHERTGARSASPTRNCRLASNRFHSTIICSRRTHIIALEGEATLRLGKERYRIKAGDYVGFPAGQRAGHCLINESDAPFRFIMIGDNQPSEVCVYPDSNKVLVRGLDRAIFRDPERLDYWDGERADEPVER